MKIGFNIAVICVVTSICVTAVILVALAAGHNSAIVTGGIASLVGIPSSIIVFLATKKRYKKE